MSEKIIKIDGKEVALRSSGATYIKYRNCFKEDLFVALQKMSEVSEDGELADGAADTLMKAMYIMAVQADPKKTPVGFEEWLDQFSMLGPINAAGEIYSLLLDDQTTLDEAKKKDSQQNGK